MPIPRFSVSLRSPTLWAHTALSTVLSATLTVGLATALQAQTGPITLQAPSGPAPAFAQSTMPQAVSYFDVSATRLEGITVTELGFRSQAVGVPHVFEVWINYGGSVLNNWGIANFSLVGTVTATPIQGDALFAVDIPDIPLGGGTHGFALVTTNPGSAHTWYVGGFAHETTDANAGVAVYGSDLDFSSQTDNGIDSFGAGFSGSVTYTVGSGLPPTAGFVGKFGDGCPGALGVVEIDIPTAPVIGSPLQIRVNNLTRGCQLHVGLFNTFNSTFGVPLPLDLGPVLGTQSTCRWFVSSEFIDFAFPTAGGTALFSFPIPPNPAFVGLAGYLQALAFDITVPGQLVTSDAWVAVVQ